MLQRTDVITLFPCPSGTESEANECRPCAAFEEEDGEDDTEAETEAGADHHRGEAAVPLDVSGQHHCLAPTSAHVPRLHGVAS
jgi:hypothetical protein